MNNPSADATTYVGIDTALVNVGLFAFEPYAWFRYLPLNSSKRKGPRRLAYLRDATQEWLSDLPAIQYAAIEDGAFSAAGRLYQLGGIQHVLQLEAWAHLSGGLIEVAPAQLKKFQTGKPGALKEWMVEAANEFLSRHAGGPKWLDVVIEDDNLADAFGLARIAHAVYTDKVQTRAEAEVVHALQTSTRIHKVP